MQKLPEIGSGRNVAAGISRKGAPFDGRNGKGTKKNGRAKQQNIQHYLVEHDVDRKLTEAIRDALRNGARDPMAHIAAFILESAGSKNAQPQSGGGANATSKLGGRPAGAVGTFLRVIMINDVYVLDNFPHFASAVLEAKRTQERLDCVAISTLNGDFLSPCILTALDGGRGMIGGLNAAQVDYVCLGNHELDLPLDRLALRLGELNATVINSNFNNPELAAFPRYATIKVGERTALLGGFLTDDLSIYAPTPKLSFVPVDKACTEVWEAAKSELGAAPDLFLPLTHQLIHEDRQTAEAIGKHPELGSRTPCLFGGHEHDMFIESAGNSVVCKVGSDAERFGVVDIWWDAAGKLSSQFTAVPAAEFEPEPAAAAYALEKKQWLASMMAAQIATVPEQCSSKKVRFESSGLATFLLSLVKKGLADEGVELVLLQGGGVRGTADYEPGPLTMGDLYKEFGFDTNMAVIDVQGQILAESIMNSRSAPKPAPNFLHADDGVHIDADHKLLSINGEALDPARIYKVGIYQFLLTGLNVIQPLLSYVQENVQVPSAEVCKPIKLIVLKYCTKQAALELFDMVGGAENVLAAMDSNADGVLDIEEVRTYLEAHGKPTGLLPQMMNLLDADEDGLVTEADMVAFKV